MSGTPDTLEGLTIYGQGEQQWPDPPRPAELRPDIQHELGRWLTRNTVTIVTDPSVENLCATALIHWHLGTGEHVTEADELWAQARSSDSYTTTAENDTARTLTGIFYELGEYDLAWRTLRLVVARLREERLERQGYTAHLAADLATTRDITRPLVQPFATDAERLWTAASKAGEEVNPQYIDRNRVMFMEQPGGPVMVSATPAGRDVDVVTVTLPLL